MQEYGHLYLLSEHGRRTRFQFHPIDQKAWMIFSASGSEKTYRIRLPKSSQITRRQLFRKRSGAVSLLDLHPAPAVRAIHPGTGKKGG